MYISKKSERFALIELSILVIIWGAILVSPVLVYFDSNSIRWDQIFETWQRFMPFIILSLFNHFILYPLFLLKNKKIQYLIFAGATLLVFAIFMSKTQINEEQDHTGLINSENVRSHSQLSQQNYPGLHPGGRVEEQKIKEKSIWGIPIYMGSALIALLIIGFDTGMRSVFRWTILEQEKDQFESEKIKSELSFLRNQLNPHFLMNTLNNIHALVDIDSRIAKDTIISLSKLMRYLLYDTDHDFITIKQELEFISGYVELMQIRTSNRVKVSLNIDAVNPEKRVPPLLFTSLIENAFKYGVSNLKKSCIDISFKTDDENLYFESINTISNVADTNDKHSGIGLQNTRKRLDILYGEKYKLYITEEDNIFTVKLKLPI